MLFFLLIYCNVDIIKIHSSLAAFTAFFQLKAAQIDTWDDTWHLKILKVFETILKIYIKLKLIGIKTLKIIFFNFKLMKKQFLAKYHQKYSPLVHTRCKQKTNKVSKANRGTIESKQTWIFDENVQTWERVSVNKQLHEYFSLYLHLLLTNITCNFI